MGCICQICGKKYKIDLLIPISLWEKIKPKGKEKDAGLMCGSCIMKRVEGLNIYGILEISKVLIGSLNCKNILQLPAKRIIKKDIKLIYIIKQTVKNVSNFLKKLKD